MDFAIQEEGPIAFEIEFFWMFCVAPRLILMITKQIEGIQTIEKVLMLFKGKIVILLKS